MGRRFKDKPPEPGQTQALVTRALPSAPTTEKLSDQKRELALLSRVKLDANLDRVIDSIMALPNQYEVVGPQGARTDLAPLKLKLEAVQWLADRGYGKAPQVIKLDDDEDTPDSILRKLSARKFEELKVLAEANILRANAIDAEFVSEEKKEDPAP